jgi:Fic family protein
MESLGFKLQNEASLQTLTVEVVKSNEIEGETLPVDQVRSSLARRLGIDIGGMVPADRNVEGVVEVMIDATQNFASKLMAGRLFAWHSAMFPAGRSGLRKITVGSWRDNTPDDPMQVVSGSAGRERVHFEAPPSARLKAEMKLFLKWFNTPGSIDPVLKAGVAHLWFLTVHPFDDGNGRMARAIADMQLARSDESPRRFYSMSGQIRKERNDYYDILERTQEGSLDITAWLSWFLACLGRALASTDDTLSGVLSRSKFWEHHAHATFNPRQKIMLAKLLEGFEGNLTTAKWAKIAKCSHDTALRDIQDLVSRSVLLQESGGRSTHYKVILP